MSQSLPSRWEPSDVLNIITPRNDISCAGITQQGLPCRWRLDGDIKAQIRDLLAQMSRKSPRRALNDLPELVRLCLCETNHRNQATRVLSKWTPLVENYATLLESRETRLPHELGSSPEATAGSPSNRSARTSRPRPASPSLDDIIAEIEVLDIRRSQLQRVLQKRLSEMGSQSRDSSPDSSNPNSTPTSPEEVSPSSSSKTVGSGSRGFKKIFGGRKG